MSFILSFIIKMISTELTKTVIGYGLNKLLESSSDGITKDIAQVMIDGVAKSKANPTTDDMFVEAAILLNQRG